MERSGSLMTVAGGFLGGFVALSQSRQRQDGPDQEPDGQQVIETGGDRQRLHVQQGHHGELVAHVVQVVHQCEEREKAEQGQKDHCARAIDLSGQVATCSTHEGKRSGARKRESLTNPAAGR